MEKSFDEILKEFEDLKKEYPNLKQNTEPTLTFEEVGEYLNSQEFVELLSKFSYENINHIRAITNRLIGIAMDYADIFRNSGTSSIDELKEILRGVVKRMNNKEDYDLLEVYENKLKRDLGLLKKDELSKEEDDEIKDKIISILAFRQTKFHAFNGCFLDSIKENGINPSTKTSDAAKDELDELHKKYGLFWKESIKSDKGNVSYSGTASVSYNYAQTSPEWFNNMCATCFQSRDYEGAKREFERTSSNFSPEDKARYMKIFERCWKQYSGNKTYLAVVTDVVAHDYEDLVSIRNKFLDYDSSFAFKVLAYSMRDKESYVNERTNSKIDTANASFIELPDLIELEKKIEQIQLMKREEGITD